MENKTKVNSSHSDLILNALEITAPIEALYCFAYSSTRQTRCNLLNIQQYADELHHYYLLVIRKNARPSSMELQHNAMQLLPETIKLTILTEDSEQLRKQLKKGDKFLTSLMQSAECWYQEKSLMLPATIKETLEPNLLKNIWQQKHQKAIYLQQSYSTDQIEGPANETSMYMLVLAIEQISFALIQLILAYTPTSANLNHLLDLCDLIHPEIAQDFQRNIPAHQILFNKLIATQQKFRYTHNFKTSEKEVIDLHKKTKSFIQKADHFVQAYFQEQYPCKTDEISQVEHSSVNCN